MGKRMDSIAPWSIELQKRRKSIGSQPASRAQRGDAKTSGLTRAHVRTTHEDPNPRYSVATTDPNSSSARICSEECQMSIILSQLRYPQTRKPVNRSLTGFGNSLRQEL
jgi:hypothetical protein